MQALSSGSQGNIIQSKNEFTSIMPSRDQMKAADMPENAATAPILDEARWRSIVVEPTQQLLAAWARSTAVREIIQVFVIEEIVGATEVIQFRDVYRFLEELSISRSSLVAKFAEVPPGQSEVERLAGEILARFAGGGMASKLGTGSGAMRFLDLYRMLEVLGISKRKFLAKFSYGIGDLDQPTASGPRLGAYVIRREIGSGFHGACCYLAEHYKTSERVAVKWPLPPGELTILRDISNKASLYPGLPQVFAGGNYGGAAYVATDLLGSPLTRVFERLQDHSLESRWKALQVIGRLLVRRLEAVHRCGYVHCDISPENVLLGQSRLANTKQASAVTPYLIDFGLARRHPNGPPLEGAKGSNEWSSIRSADGGRRLPEDDLEAVGWILANGLFGELPWFERLGSAYPFWEDCVARVTAVMHARESKLQLMEGGWDSHSGRWQKLKDVPEDLDLYLKACRVSGLDNEKCPPSAGRRPDYMHLLTFLGGSPIGLEPEDVVEAEEYELRCYAKDVAPLLK